MGEIAGVGSEARSPISGRLRSVEEEFAKLQAERDEALRERDAARAAFGPLLVDVEELRAKIAAYLPKQDTRLPSRRMKRISQEQVADWAARNGEGESLSQIAARDGTHQDTVKKALVEAGITPRMQARKGKGAREEEEAEPGEGDEPVGRCRDCGLPFDSPALTTGNVAEPDENGVCGLCQFMVSDLAAKRAASKAA